MPVDPSRFHLFNVTDTCAVWNILSSVKLYHRSKEANVQFFCTDFVIYECLYKPRRSINGTETTLIERLRESQEKGDFASYPLSIEDLQTVEILENRKRLGLGELSSIALAMKTRQAFLTDDQKARKLGSEFMTTPGPQTTPHLVGWLFFHGHLIDQEKTDVIEEHESMERPLSKYFEIMYMEAMRCRLLS